jgi:hypothetical protein
VRGLLLHEEWQIERFDCYPALNIMLKHGRAARLRVRREAFDPTLTLFVKRSIGGYMKIGVALRLTGFSFVMALAGSTLCWNENRCGTSNDGFGIL